MEEKKGDTSTFHSFESSKNNSSFLPYLFVIISIAIVLGILTGFILTKKLHMISMTQTTLGSAVEKGNIYGSTDTSTFKDTAEGILQKGGIADEGQYHLVRAGGDSQNVYLTSSSVDLSKFIGKKIRVHGSTQTAKKAGWLMDAGQVEVLE